MFDFSILGNVVEPSQKKMTSDEFIQFCDFCLKNNPHITSKNCLPRKTGEEEIEIPFRL